MTERHAHENIWQRALNKGAAMLRPLLGKSDEAAQADKSAEPNPEIPCCSPEVHIAYRGKSDDRMYMAYNRRWQEVRFYQPNGLRVFCATCRRRVY
jgi:hypothetical protein